MILNVPYYRQLAPGSCGPAALIMVLRYYDDSLANSRLTELRIWMDSMLWPFLMTDAFGLATAACHYGFRSMIIVGEEGFNLRFPSEPDSGDGSGSFSRLLLPPYILQRRRAALKDVQIERGLPNVETLKDFLRRGIPPVVMVDQSRYLDDDTERVLHWVVVVGLDGELLVNDPEVGPRLKVSFDDFREAMDLKDWGIGPRVLAVWK